MRDTVRLTREKVFEMVWSGPKSKVAKDLGISDVAVTKICRKLAVPMPPQGYWVRKHRPKRPVLAPTKGATFHDLKIPEIRSTPTDDPIDPEAAKLIAYEKAPRNQITVGKQLRSPHPIVVVTKAALLGSKPDDYGRLGARDKECPGIFVCRPSVDRAMLILDALLKALKQRNFNVRPCSFSQKVSKLSASLPCRAWKSSRVRIFSSSPARGPTQLAAHRP